MTALSMLRLLIEPIMYQEFTFVGGVNMFLFTILLLFPFVAEVTIALVGNL